jgi:hypothetical protein
MRQRTRRRLVQLNGEKITSQSNVWGMPWGYRYVYSYFGRDFQELPAQ